MQTAEPPARPGAPPPREVEGAGAVTVASTPAHPTDPWSRVRAEASKQPALWAIVQRLTLDSLEGSRVVLQCPPESAGMAGKIAAPKLVEMFARHGVAGASITLKPTARAPEPEGAGVPPSAPAPRAAEPAAPAGPNPAENPLVKRVQQVLGARVTRVVPRKKG